ncbi:MAG: 1-acyl-sn-glycerol-3-phosphate acyltransferase [Alphaproteobacteria bacterium]|nr:1-acyl-sn-glycerol-3-phosphate acyltransferase [Alphaproteobacteria bacterium]
MLNDFPAPHPIRFQGSRWARRVLGWLGWQVHFDGLPTLQGVAIVYPHTSNWDFIIAMLAKAAMGIEIHFWAKDSLFRIPGFGRCLSHFGGVPVNRHAPGGVVNDMIEQLQQAQSESRLFWLGLSPEGTRSFQPGWRSGFYRLAFQSHMPLAVGTLDYGRRELRLQHFIRLSGNPQNDYVRIEAIVGHAKGFHPQQAAPVRPLPPSDTVKEQS